MTALTTAEFLRLILPDFGWKCLFTLPDRKHYWYTDIDPMADAALRFDAQGKAVFYGCASFSNKKRIKDNVVGLCAFWLDIDAGLGKPYPDARAACGAVEEWRSGVNLPLPQYVVSGGGVHAYWPLRNPVDRAGWDRAAQGLRTLAQNGGLKLDPGITIDAARIMRPPGTNNRKIINHVTGKSEADVGGPARPVYAGPMVERYDTAEILTLLSGGAPHALPGAFGGREAAGSSLLPTPQPLNLPTGLEASIVGGTNSESQERHDPSDAEQVLSMCQQVSLLRTAPGKQSEPQWYAVLGVLAHCGDTGRVVAHSFATSEDWLDEIDRKYAQAARVAGPTTCARFGQINPAGCVGCAHAGRVVSPIQLGRNLSASVLAPSPDDIDLPRLPDPYKWSNGKLKVPVPKGKDGEHHDFVISDYPVYIREFQRGERSEGVSAVFSLWEPMPKKWVEFCLPLKDVLGDRGSSLLAHHGSPFSKIQWGHFQGLVIKSNIEYRGTDHYKTRYDQFGWKFPPAGGAAAAGNPVTGPAFALGEELIGQVNGPSHAFGSPEFTRRGRLMAAHGSLAGWKAAAEGLFQGNEGHAFALLCSFAAPLYHMTGEQGGTIVHMRSPGSGTGKTTAIDATESVWGDRFSLQLQERDTINAKFISTGTLNHLPVVFDELRARDFEIIKEFVLHFTLGKDKARGAADGGLRTDSLPWSTILLSASNISLVDTVKHDGVETAHAARIFEFRATLNRTLPVAEGDRLRELLRQNRGTAGRAFIRAVLRDYEGVRSAVHEAYDRLGRALGSEGEFRYILRLFACVAVAGQICQQNGILDVDIGKVMRWAVSATSATQKITEMDVGDVVGQLINDLLPFTLVMPNAPRAGPRTTEIPAIREPRGELKARYELDHRRLWIDEREVKSWLVKHNYAITEIRELLTKEGILVKAGEKKTLAAGSNLPKSQVRTWEIDGAHAMIAELVEASVPDNVVKMERRT